jgi:RNA polymerase sigma-70 factor (ECF subfamily)
MATADELAAAFAQKWSGRDAAQTTGIGLRLVELCNEARQAYPNLTIDDIDLVLSIAARAPATDLADYLRRCRSGDLAVAAAAAKGSESAIAELERAHRTTIDATCRRFAGPGQTADDLKQILRAKLFVAEPGKQPKIGDYAGQGFLDNWLRVTAVRVFLDLQKRKDRTREAPAEEDDVMALPQPGDLALDVVKAEYRTAVTEAMHEAARLLEPGDRHLLRQHLVVGLSIDQLGPVLGIHRATAARRIARAKEQLVAETRRQLAAKLKLDERELDDVIGLVMSRLDVSIGKLLQTRAGDSEEANK